ncbi:hypothetical protein LUZ60_012912 [Juncus effusus]|nr:hypothetical protein LUZ60_012912 [Juncus effusus]
MSRVKDRTEDFKEAARVAALSNGYTESQVAALIASFIMHKSVPKSPFTKSAIKTHQSINELEKFIIKHRKDYTDLRRATDQERDNIEHEVRVFVNACKDQIDILQKRINEKEERGDSKTSSNADLVAHKTGIVFILSERLKSVTPQFNKLRSERFQNSFNKALPRRKIVRKTETKSSEIPALESRNFEEHETYSSSSNSTVTVQQQLLDNETAALQDELTGLLDAVQETETKMMEMSMLNHLISTHVQQQAQQIEQLYQQAVEATNNVERGNKELSQAIQRNQGSRTFLMLFFFVLTFSVLFLDWYS